MPIYGNIQINDMYCKGCALCLPVCPQGVMAMDNSRLTPKGYHPASLVKEGCTGCALCAIVCPDSAITVYRTVNHDR